MSNINVPGGTDIYIRDNAGIQYSTDLVLWNLVTFPTTITNTSPGTGIVTVIFTTDIGINNNNEYFICGSSDIQFGSSTLNSDGSRPTFVISAGANDYPGLIQNNTSYDNISIYNLVIDSSGSTLKLDGGWIAQTGFARNAVVSNLIVNCSSNGDIINGGGIVGTSSAINGGTLIIRGCTTSGNIFNNSGGIASYGCGRNASSYLIIDRCSSSGTIAADSGGIVGNSCGILGGSVTVSNSYSTGYNNGGGIFGVSAGVANGIVSAINCYSTGIIVRGGGIFGLSAGLFGGSAIATNCFSTGDITNESGGIYGIGYDNAVANNCYTSGAVDSALSGGIWPGSNIDNLPGSTNNYAESNHGSSGWNTTNAAAHLTGVPSSSYYGTSWCSPVVGAAYKLSLSGYTPYSISLTESITQSVVAGNSTTAGIVPGYTYLLLAINGGFPNSIPEITIDSVTGVISVDASLAGGVYTVIVYSSINPYSITIVTLNVSDAPVIIGTSCCALPMNLPNNDYVKRNEVISGNTILGNMSQGDIISGNTVISIKNRRQLFPSYSFYYNMKMAQASKR